MYLWVRDQQENYSEGIAHTSRMFELRMMLSKTSKSQSLHSNDLQRYFDDELIIIPLKWKRTALKENRLLALIERYVLCAIHQHYLL